MNGLTFAELREANLRRVEAVWHPLDDYSPNDWFCRLATEVGEIGGELTKLRRGQPVEVGDLARELADAQCYLDLLAARFRIDLGEAVARKFNEVSEKVGSDVGFYQTHDSAGRLWMMGSDGVPYAASDYAAEVPPLSESSPAGDRRAAPKVEALWTAPGGTVFKNPEAFGD